MKKEMVAIAVAVVILVGLVAVFGPGGKKTEVKFETIPAEKMPRELEAEILPEYRDLERALACRAGDQIYVLVTRGEKPTAGYEVEIESMTLENRADKSCLIVNAVFADPEEPENMAQIKSYPAAAAKADLKGLPDTIELRSEYLR